MLLAAVLANKALTDRAAKLDQDAETVRAKLGKAPPVRKRIHSVRPWN